MIAYFEEELKKYVDSYENNKFTDALKYVLTTGGKRVRPLLVLNLAKSLNKDYKELIDLAIAIELIHNYSLIHDDMPCMDNDNYRRGKLTLHKKYNEYTALLAGCALLTDAINLIANSNKLHNKDKIIACITNKIGTNGLIIGQFYDMEYANKLIDEKTIKFIHTKKTTELIEASILSVLIHFDIDDKKYEEVAENIGAIYQLQDDIFDYNNKEDKSNYAKIIGISRANQLLLKYIDRIKELLADNKKFLEYILQIINRSY